MNGLRAVQVLVLCSGLLALPARAQPVAHEPPAIVAITVGSTVSPDARVEHLRYADDDAIQNARAIALLGGNAILLVTPDAETREIGPVETAGPATRAALVAAFERAFAALTEYKQAHRSTRFYFFFAGHGDVDGDWPFLQLEDARFWREDLVEFLQRLPADENHVIVDACQASLFVGGRGPGGERISVAPGFATAGRLPWPAHTGFFSARSSGGQTHEWAEFQAGIFSHELRSGLLGGADVDLDGRITYLELASFIRRANQSIANRKYRPEVVATPPRGNLDAVFANLPAGTPTGAMILELDRQPLGRAFVETEKGVRLADLHAAPGQTVRLRLPRDLGAMFVQRMEPREEFRIEPDAQDVALSRLAALPPRVISRGAAHEAFLQLFALPFDNGAVSSYRIEADLLDHPPPAPPKPRQWLPWSLVGAGTAAIVTGVAIAISAHLLSADESASGVQRITNGQIIQDRNRAAFVVGGAGAVAVSAGLSLLWWRGSF